MSDNPLANVGDLAKPFDTLVKKISKGVGTLYEPRRIKNVAKAEAEASKMKAESEIEITDLHRRAEQRRIEEEAKHQKNMEDITAKAAPHLNEDANPDAMDDDWVANLFDKCRIVSNDEMQSLWARVLAGEANTPGTYSKRTVNLLSDFDKNDADLFTRLCGFGWVIGNVVPLVFDVQADIYNRNEINFDTLNHLETIGLIQFGGLSGFKRIGVSKRFVVYYYSKPLSLEIPEDANNELKTGKVFLTKIGQELAPICGSKPVEGFYEYVKEQWKQYLPAVKND
ncbi:DUF2806 domain-containing protein [Candidatus Poribacteria bacterium]|nr:DUF2806 domain-containing protein [Candidatus Poribacteria bacterium]MYA99345.1 DUF2806 domain-containing protein [Candidatus Poribacteria bacterium]